MALRKAGVHISGNVVCRQTAFTSNMPRQWAKVRPTISKISALHQEMDPARHAKQLAFVRDHIDPAYRIDDTAYTTVSVNRNHVTPIHVDRGDFAGGSGAMLIAGDGFRGCQLCFPRYGVAVELEPGDVVVCNVHEWHGNLPLELDDEAGQRLSIVAYVREKLAMCTRKIGNFGVPDGAIIDPHDPAEPRRPLRRRNVRIRRFVAGWRIQKGRGVLRAVADYATKFGRVPPVGAKHMGIAVGIWCFHRRDEKRRGKLSTERALEIEATVPGWVWEPERRDTSHALAAKRQTAAASFAASLSMLEAFVAANGCLPRARDHTGGDDGVALGKWVVNRRQDIKNGRASTHDVTRDWSRLAELLGMQLAAP